MAEWLKAHAWKACRGETPSRVRIPVSPPGLVGWPLCPACHFQYDVTTGENHYPKNVYPEDYPRLQEQLQPLKTHPVQVTDGDVWVDLDGAGAS